MKKLVIVDKDEEYLRALLSLIRSSKLFDYNIYGFSSLVELKSFSAENTIEVLLINSVLRASKHFNIICNNIFLLGEKDDGEKNSIYKYQSSSNILEALTGERNVLLKSSHIKGDVEIIGVMSKTNGMLKPEIVLAMNDNKRSLYISIDYCDGINTLIDTNEKDNISNIIYYLVKADNNIVNIIMSTRKRFVGKDIILPFKRIDEVKEISFDIWERLIQKLREFKIYEKIYIDISDYMQNYTQIICMLDKVIYPIEIGSSYEVIDEKYLKDFEKVYPTAYSKILVQKIPIKKCRSNNKLKEYLDYG